MGIRRTVFWLHLCSGAVAGIVIFIGKAITGACKVRTWMRFLHTGEALGSTGKLIAGLASLGGALLVWTGLALACRRFLAWRRKPVLEVPLVEANQEVPVP